LTKKGEDGEVRWANDINVELGLSRISELNERWSDGRFMAHEDWVQIERENEEAAYLRYDTGGFAHAAAATPADEGTFL
jgi:hypothetical protein